MGVSSARNHHRNGKVVKKRGSWALLTIIAAFSYLHLHRYVATKDGIADTSWLPNERRAAQVEGPRSSEIEATITGRTGEPLFQGVDENLPVGWPEKLGRCSLSRWPSMIMLVAKGFPVQMQAIEWEKTNDNKLAVLISAVSKERELSTSALLESTLSSLRCDFRRGNIALNSKYAPLHRSSVELSVLREDKKQGFLLAKLTCALPAPAKVLTKGNVVVPDILQVYEMEERKKVVAEREEWLHWQLIFDIRNVESRRSRTWVAAPSIPLCDTSNIGLLEKRWYSERAGPSADDYTSWEKESRGDSMEGAALCVAPSPSSETLKTWVTSPILEWVYYQKHVVGFSSIFYLDPFGEELLQIHPEVSASFGSELLHAPHTAMYKSMASLMRAGPVAESLVKERCSMLARERDVNYVLLVKNPMDLVLPLKRRRRMLPLALGNALQSHCAETLQLSQIEWFPRNESCHDDWCNLPDAHDPVSQFLTGGKPGALDTTPSSEHALFYSALQNPTRMSCKKRSSLPPDSITIVTKSSTTVPVNADTFPGTSTTNFSNRQLESVILSMVAWVKRILQTSIVSREQTLAFRRKKRHSGMAWVPFPMHADVPIRTCSDFDYAGPHYGKAILFQENHGARLASNREEDILHLTFFNAEVIKNRKKRYPVISLAVNVEDLDSVSLSMYHEEAFGALYQSKNVRDLLPNVTCVFSHPDPKERVLAIPAELRTRGEWRSFDRNAKNELLVAPILWWLDCPVPRLPGLPDVSGMASLVTIDASDPLPRGTNLHMIRPIKLCFGAEASWHGSSVEGTEESCDDVSVACWVGCVDDARHHWDPQAQCCSRCDERHVPNERYDRRDSLISRSSNVSQGAGQAGGYDLPGNNGSQLDRSNDNSTSMAMSVTSDLRGSISICTKPLFFESPWTDQDGTYTFSPQRIVEWIEYHLLIGVDVIYILDRYGDQLLPLLRPYIIAGRVIHVPFPLLTDASIWSHNGNNQTSTLSYYHDQLLAYDHCLSIGRRRKDALMAFVDFDEFIRYPQPQPGALRATIAELLQNSNWTSKDSIFPDSIILDRFDITAEAEGMALGYVERFSLPRTSPRDQRREGKVLVSPGSFVHGCVMIHEALRANPKSVRRIVAPSKWLSVLHFKKNSRLEGEKTVDRSLSWAHRILSAQFIGTAGFKAMRALSRQGLLRLGEPRRENVTTSQFVTRDYRNKQPRKRSLVHWYSFVLRCS